jgi:hypothetical protein
MLTKETKVKFINNSGNIDDIECKIVEELEDIVRLEKPDGEIFRIYKDRVIYEQKCNDSIFNPWENMPEDIEVYVKTNMFSLTTSCKTIAIVHKTWSHYISCNTYNGKLGGKQVEYNIKEYEQLNDKLIKKGYEKTSKDKF